MNKKRLLRVKDVAERLDISERTVYRYIQDRTLKAVKIGGWRVEEEDLQTFIRGRVNISK